MKREFFIHFALWFWFFVLVSIVKGYIALPYWPFWVGGLLGLALPDIDHLVYIFFIKPQDLTSQRVGFLLKKKEVKRTVSLLYETREERKGLIFHSSIFQIVFLILTFWITTSSGSIFGTGLVLSFSLHILVDQLIDITETKSLDNWGSIFATKMDSKMSWIYWGTGFLLLCIFGFLV